MELVLLHLLFVLVAARFAAELAERIRQPAVLVEIAVGILIGPSLLGLVDASEILKVIGELGAILLLFEVGMQMNLGDLGRVGGNSLRVGGIGILVPMALGLAALNAFGVPESTALFLAGGITATSVGITARVFGDLRALATAEARTVLAAAVVDDVGGLLILTIVAAVASGAVITAASVAGLVGGALMFVVVATAAAAWLAPGLFRRISAHSRTEGTLMVLAVGFALVIALLASAAHLAPIIGAFIAGLALSRSDVRDEVQRRIVPLAHFFVPVFFLLIGMETRLEVFSDPQVLLTAGGLSVIAIFGKLISGLGVGRGTADRLLVGIAMIPRGEVGLIFAGIGLTAGILDSRYYGVLVLVVLITTLITPPLMRSRIQKTRRRQVASRSAAVEPEGGWLLVTPEEVDLTAEPPDLLASRIGLETAIACATRRPGPWLLQWLASAEAGPEVWDEPLRSRLFTMLRQGNERSWRFLEVTGWLRSYLPSLQKALDEKKRDAFNLDPTGVLRWSSLEDLQRLVEQHPGGRSGSPQDHFGVLQVWDRLQIKDLVLLAALARSAFENEPDAGQLALGLAESIGLGEEEAGVVEFLTAERRLLPAAARRLDMGSEDSVLELANHLGSRERADALYVLAVAEDAMEPWELERLEELFNLVQEALAHPDLMQNGGGDLVAVRRSQIFEALSHLPPEEVRRHLKAAPRRYLVAHSPQTIARHLKMTETPPGRHEVRLEAERTETLGEWLVHVAVVDQKGLLASIAGALSANRIVVQEAFVSTWRNGSAIDVFRVMAPHDADWDGVRLAIAAALAHRTNGTLAPGIEGTVDIDNLASPWHTIVEIRAYDREGLLYRVASALSRAGLHIHMAVVSTTKDVAVDIFYVTGPKGGKLDEAGERDLRLALAGKPVRRWQAPWRPRAKLDA